MFLLVELATAARYCVEANPPIPAYIPGQWSLPECTTKYLSTNTSVLDGVCAENLPGICKLDGGVASFFRVYNACLSRECGLTWERQHFVHTFQYYCGWLPTITLTQAGYFGQWNAYLFNTSTSTSQVSSPSIAVLCPILTHARQTPSTVIQQVTSFVTLLSPSTSDAISTSTRIDTVVSSLEVSAETSSTTQPSAAASADSSTSLQDDRTSSALGTGTANIARSSAPSLPLAQDKPEPALSTSAISGVAIGGILALSLIGGGVLLPTSPQAHLALAITADL
ncbi:hypothetical protein E8E12_007227 [Didymella heteroderae]|uniref:Transmembrane protein n=1 Tax=Didymella heteroderae TaxID=1769908 RepID=A0A9P4WLM6_9PLEO|nr:hypothetical protein E8E12_007227 [Didymella heteroderae]